MRNIKFRGKDKNGKWLYGSFAQVGYLSVIVQKDGSLVEVNPGIVSQYTGLKDRNGTEIYEGDLITNTDLDITLSKNVDYKLFMFRKDRAAFCIASTVDLEIMPDFDNWKTLNPTWWAAYGKKYEVMGNIYDNPELLKQKDNDNETEK